MLVNGINLRTCVYLRVDDVSHTVAQDDVREDDLSIVNVDSAIGANAEGDIVSVDSRDSGVGDVAGEDNGAGDGVVGEHAGECLDAGVGEGRGGSGEGGVVGDEDGEVRDGVDGLN